MKISLKGTGFTQVSLAEYIGVSKRTVEYWCQGKKKPSKERLAQLEELGITLFSPAPKENPPIIPTPVIEPVQGGVVSSMEDVLRMYGNKQDKPAISVPRPPRLGDLGIDNEYELKLALEKYNRKYR